MNKNNMCRICGKFPQHSVTGLCINCWDLRNKIKHSPEAARKILHELDEKKFQHNSFDTFDKRSLDKMMVIDDTINKLHKEVEEVLGKNK